MSEKHLTELPWKTLIAKQGLKDIGVGKALAAYANFTASGEVSKALGALNEIVELAPKLKKTCAAKADVVAYLDEIVKEVKKTTPGLEAKAKAGAAGQGKDTTGAGSAKPEIAAKPGTEEEDDETEAAELKKNLKQKMVSALAQVKARAPGEPEQEKEPKPQLQFMAYLAGKSCAVVVSPRVGSSTKKLLPEIAGGASGGQYIQGECIFEKNAHTFVVAKVPGGLAKKLAAGLQSETGQKYKVRVRSLDGSVTLDSDTDVEETEGADETLPGQGDWFGRFAGVEARYLKVLKTQPANASQLRAAMGSATGSAENGDFVKAGTALTRVEDLLESAKGLGKETDVIPEGIVAAMKAAFDKAQARWESGVAAARESMKPVQAELKGEFAAGVPAIDNILTSYRQDLIVLLQQAQTVQDQPSIDTAVTDVLTKVRDLRAEIGQDRLFAYLGESGTPVRPAFEDALNEIEGLLQP